MKKFKVVSIGGATRDIIYYTSEGRIFRTPEDLVRQKMIAFEYGAKLIADEVLYGLGGGGCNTAICLARLGLKAANIVAVGPDKEGEAILRNLKKERVDTQFVKVNNKSATGFSFFAIDSRSKEHVAFLYRGANDQLEIKKGELGRINTDWFYVSSLSGKKWWNISERILETVKKKKVKLAWNPGETQLRAGKKGLNKLLKYCHILILNKDESIELILNAKGKIKGINDPRVILRTILKWGPKIFVLTNGRKGAYAYDGKKIYFSPIHDSKVVDTTGAGDCFGSSFLAGLIIFKGDIKRAIKLGIRNTSSLVTKPGAQNGLLYKKDLKKIFKN